jgi:NADH-quinone oxidoreductase subunit A
MNPEPNPYWSILALIIAAVMMGLGPVLAARVCAHLLSTRKRGPVKDSTYECGLESKGDAWIQFKPGFYLYAIVFLVFDVEVVFLLPFAVAFTGLPMGAFLAMMVFLLLLAEGLVWAWLKGVLTWR